MPETRIKTPNLDEIFEKWKQTAYRKDRKKIEKQFGTKGAVFSLDAISAAEYVKDTLKEAAIYFAIKQDLGAVSDKKEEKTVLPPKIPKEEFYSFKGSNSIDKSEWKGPESVPWYDTIKPIPCKKCNGKGYIESKCSKCNGTGKINETVFVLSGQERKKEKKTFIYSCNSCYGTGTKKEQCKECEGYKNLYKYEILPVPFKTVIVGLPVIHCSTQTKYEKEIGEDLHKMLEDVEGIKFSDFKELEDKAETSLGYWNKNIKKTISAAKSDYKKYKGNKSAQIITPIYLFPMIQLMCQTKKGSKFEIYSLGSANKFMIYSNF